MPRKTKSCRGLKVPKQVIDLAYRIHRCPPGYKGPCWGPTQSDICCAQAKIDIAAIRAERRAKEKK